MELYTVNWKELRKLCQKLLMAERMPEEDAFICADNLVDADLCGVESHGVSRLSNYMKRLNSGVVSCEGEHTVEMEFPSSIKINGCNSMGMVNGFFAMEQCIEKARVSGCCFAVVNHSNHYGIASYYAGMAAKADMIGITGTNAPPNLAPWGSKKKYMGTNPLAIAAPIAGDGAATNENSLTDRDPIILDMAPSVVAMGKIILAAKLGKAIPEGWALTEEGKPTTDPIQGQRGMLLPIGGAKGSGMAIFMEILCGILADAQFGPHINHFWNDFVNPQNAGHFFCAIDISKFIPADHFKLRLRQMVNEIKALPKCDGVECIYMPGEIESIKRQERKEKGIDLSDSVYKELQELADKYQVPFSL